MMRTWMVSVGLMVCGLLAAGCDSANNAAKKASSEAKEAAKGVKESAKEAAKEAKEGAKEAAKEAKEGAKESLEAAKVAVLKPIEDALPKIKDKIKGLSGESATKAKEKFEEFEKLLEQFKSAAPGKWESLKDQLTKSFGELKKLVGMDK